jgi:hypothetical protein
MEARRDIYRAIEKEKKISLKLVSLPTYTDVCKGI